MTQQDNGGAAFPRYAYSHSDKDGVSYYDVSGGMSLRDWFAGQALAGMLSNCDESGLNGWGGLYDPAAKEAYNFADALLAARSAK